MLDHDGRASAICISHRTRLFPCLAKLGRASSSSRDEYGDLFYWRHDGDCGLGASFVEWPAARPSYRKSAPGEVRVSALSGGSHAWLIVSENHAPVGSLSTAGAVGVQQGTAAGTAGPVTLWHQDSPGIKGKAEMYDRFGTIG